jgi:hypothetical protein
MTDRKTQGSEIQARKFEDAARALGCDESEEHFNAALAKVARQKTKIADADKIERPKAPAKNE